MGTRCRWGRVSMGTCLKLHINFMSIKTCKNRHVLKWLRPQVADAFVNIWIYLAKSSWFNALITKNQQKDAKKCTFPSGCPQVAPSGSSGFPKWLKKNGNISIPAFCTPMGMCLKLHINFMSIKTCKNRHVPLCVLPSLDFLQINPVGLFHEK